MHYCVYNSKDLEFLDMTSSSGSRAYTRTLFFVLCKAVKDIFPASPDVIIDIPVSNGFYVDVRLGKELTEEEVGKLRIVGDEPEMHGDGALYLLEKGDVGHGDSVHDEIAEHQYLFRDDLLEELVLGAEIVVEHGVGHSGGLSYGRGACSVVSLEHKLALGGFEDLSFGDL